MNKTLEQFYIENRELLLKRLYHRAGSAENAEDVLQEAFCRALKYWNSFNPNTQEIGAWFNTIMNNSLRTFKRDERSMGTFVEYEDELTEGYEMSQTSGDMFKRIEAEINKFKGENRSALHLYFIKGYKPREVRDVLDIQYKTLEKLFSRFKHDMREKYGD
jgi:RNA polymerase sigma factor (sigma-70 family)